MSTLIKGGISESSAPYYKLVRGNDLLPRWNLRIESVFGDVDTETYSPGSPKGRRGMNPSLPLAPWGVSLQLARRKKMRIARVEVARARAISRS